MDFNYRKFSNISCAKSQILNVSHLVLQLTQGWGEYWTYEYEYWKISTRVVLEYNVFSIFMFIILYKTSTRVVLAPALAVVFVQYIEVRCWVENEDVVGAAPTGDAPTTSEWSTIVLPTKVRLI